MVSGCTVWEFSVLFAVSADAVCFAGARFVAVLISFNDGIASRAPASRESNRPSANACGFFRYKASITLRVLIPCPGCNILILLAIDQEVSVVFTGPYILLSAVIIDLSMRSFPKGAAGTQQKAPKLCLVGGVFTSLQAMNLNDIG